MRACNHIIYIATPVHPISTYSIYLLHPMHIPQPAPEPAFDPTKLPTSEEIRVKVRLIREMYNAGKTLTEVRVQHTEFARQYPKLVDTLMQPNLDTKQLRYMLSMFDRVRNQQISFQRASHKVGKSMFDQYLAPNLTPEQLATVQAKLKGLENAPPEEIARQAAALSQTTQMGQTDITTNPTNPDV